MQILYKGIPPKEVRYQSTCSNCKSVLQYRKEEVKYEGSHRNGTYYSYTCPVCESNQTVEEGYSMKEIKD